MTFLRPDSKGTLKYLFLMGLLHIGGQIELLYYVNNENTRTEKIIYYLRKEKEMSSIEMKTELREINRKGM